ncbi:L-alanine-DL-glutamate epimerase [Lysinibacillus sphaericus]|uniref:dipeptide epimerase n=1 Tax=Lysinibacillus TaxID=400634 RepID=UPI00084BB5E4|nr:dipeptide epimerase [Lysinibacillus sphaericus]OEC03569.1 L-alanine-DL-glutamate epimerase [Lysinibacillus sphaericus]
MKIKDIVVATVKAPLIVPFKTALRTVQSIENIAVYVHSEHGQIGIGEAAPTAVITGETLGSIRDAIEHYIKPAIVGMDIQEIALVMERMDNSIYQNTSAKAAVDMALYDLLAQLHKTPLYKLLGGYRKALTTDITISVNSVAHMIKDSLSAVERGFQILKVKVGKDPATDIQRVMAIRDAVGKAVTLRVDANQGWTPKEAVRIIRALEDADSNIELVEQPVHYADLTGMQYVTANTLTNILADESVFSAKDALTIIERRAADFINIKLMKTGGIFHAQKICHIAEAHGIACMMGCMLETKISVSAAAHFAASQKNITMIDLDGPSLCLKDPIAGGPIFNNDRITMTDANGIGFSR